MQRVATTATVVSALGAVDVYTPSVHGGRISKIRYVPDGTSPLDTGADIVITEEQTGAVILTKANIGTAAVEWSPRGPTHSVGAGAAALYAAGGEAVNDVAGPPVAQSRIKVAITNGGNALATGVFYFWID